MPKDSPKAKKKVEEVHDPVAPPAAKPKASGEIPEPKAEPTGVAEEEGKETGERPEKKKSKKGAEQRIRQLAREKKQALAKAESLEDKLAELTAPVEPQAARRQPPTPQQDEPFAKEGEQISASELNRRMKAREQKILQQADAGAQLRARQSEAVNRINNEASEVIRDHPELDPKSGSFNKELSDAITAATEAHVRANPYTASVKKFVAKLMKPYKKAVEQEVGEVTEKVAKQASETALRPTSVKGGKKKFKDLTLKQQEKKLGVVY